MAGLWHDCASQDQSISLDGWSDALNCPNASELCAGSEDEGWPEVLALSPSSGPVAGGTLVTLVGRAFGASSRGGAGGTSGAGGAGGTRVLVCSVEAEVLSLTPLAQAGGAQGAAAGEVAAGLQAAWEGGEGAEEQGSGNIDGGTALVSLVVRIGAAEGWEGNTSCHVRVLRPDGTYAEWYDGFTYVGPPPRQPPLDLTNFDLDTAVSLGMRAWPYILSAILLLEALRALRDVSTDLKVRRRPNQLPRHHPSPHCPNQSHPPRPHCPDHLPSHLSNPHLSSPPLRIQGASPRARRPRHHRRRRGRPHRDAQAGQHRARHPPLDILPQPLADSPHGRGRGERGRG